MKRKIFIKDRELIYDFSRKKIKNINMRIHNDGGVFVSAPAGISFQTVEAFINSHADWIIKHVDRLTASYNNTEFEIKSKANISILGENYVLSVNQSNRISCYIKDSELILNLPETSDAEATKKILSAFLENLLKETLNTMCHNIYEKHFKELNIQYPDILIRKMKARWGSCHSQKHKIIFNKRLVFLPKKSIEYIIYHEFTHFINPDHSADFYKTLKSFLPDIYERKNELKKYDNSINFVF